MPFPKRTIEQELIDWFAAADDVRLGERTDFDVSAIENLAPSSSEKLRRMNCCAEQLAQAAHSGVNLLLDRPTEVPEATVAETSGDTGLEIQQQYAGYEIVRILGRGGFGIVYEGYDQRLNRPVALKVPLPHVVADESSRRRFHTEGRASAALEHPNIVVVHETLLETHPAIVFEYCEGGTLKELVERRGQLSEPEIVDIAICIVRGLNHAHARGVLHRDLKPGNVLFSKSGAEERANGLLMEDEWLVPKISDFGLAKILDDQSDNTQSNVILGSLNFMAPEQATGQASQAGTYTDLFSFGALLYWLLTGRPPFKSESQMSTLLRLEACNPESVGNLRPQMSTELQLICHKCLQRRPENRYESAAALLGDLQALRDGRPISLRPARTHERLYQWYRRHKILAAWLCGLAVLMVTVFALQSIHSSEQKKLIGELNETNITLQKSIVREQRSSEHAQKQQEIAKELYARADLMFAAKLVEEGNHQLALPRLRRLRQNLKESDSPDFAWRYLTAASTEQLLKLEDHPEKVWSTALAKDRKIFATGDTIGTIFIRDILSGDLIATLEQFPGEVCDLLFSPDEKLLAACGTGGLIRLYDTDTWEVQKNLNRHGKTVKALAFTPDGNQLISGSRDDDLVYWDTQDSSVIRRVSAHDVVQHISMSADGKFLVSGGSDGKTKVWNVETGEAVAEFHGHKHAVLCTAISTDGSLVAGGGYDRHVCIWNVKTGVQLTRFETRNSSWSMKFVDADQRLAVGDGDGELNVYEWDESSHWRTTRRVRCHSMKLRSFEILTKPNRLVTVSDDCTVCLHSGPVGSLARRRLLRHSGSVHWSADGDRLLVGQDHGHLQIFSAEADLLISHRNRHFPMPYTVWQMGAALSDRNVAITTGVEQKWVNLSKVFADGTDETIVLHHEKDIRFSTVSPDGRLVAVATTDSIHLWDVDTARELSSHAVDNTPKSCSFSDDSRRLAVSHDDVVEVWSFNSSGGVVRQTLRTDGIASAFVSAAFDKQQRFLTASYSDGVLFVWDLSTGERIADIPFAADWGSTALAFTPLHGLLAVGTTDVRLIDVASGEMILRFGDIGDSNQTYHGLDFSADGTRLAAVHDTQDSDKDEAPSVLSIWDVAP